jgi:hypothetical protein
MDSQEVEASGLFFADVKKRVSEETLGFIVVISHR